MNRMYDSPRTILFIGAWVPLGVLLVSTAALGADAKSYQQQLEQRSQKIAVMRASDTGETMQDIEVLRTWIGQAQAYVANDKLKKVPAVLERIDAYSEFIAAKQKQVAAEKRADAAEAKANRLKQEAAEAMNKAEQTLSRMQQFEARGL